MYDEGLCKIAEDLRVNTRKRELLTCIALSIMISSILFLCKKEFCPEQTTQIIDSAITILTTLAGFTLAGYTIILPLGNIPAMKGNDGEAYHKLCGTFAATLLMQLVSIGIVFIWKFLSCQWGIYVIMTLVLIALSLSINLLFHLLSIRTVIISFKKNRLK